MLDCRQANCQFLWSVECDMSTSLVLMDSCDLNPDKWYSTSTSSCYSITLSLLGIIEVYVELAVPDYVGYLSFIWLRPITCVLISL